MDEIIVNFMNGNLFLLLFGLIAIGGGLYVLFTDNVLYGAYGLLVSFLGVAGLFVFAGGEFIAAAQIMIYVGGVLVLLIFGIMLSGEINNRDSRLLIKNQNPFFTLILVVVLSIMMLFFVSTAVFEQKVISEYLKVSQLGFELMTNAVLVLELIGLLLLAGLIGATFIAKNNE